MKERIVKYKHKKEDCKKCMYEGICSSPLCETEKVEQVPTNWEELKELCKDIKGIGFAGGNAKGEIIQLDNIWFAENGDIWGYSENWEEVCVIGKNRTPAQMWDIIKSLIGEE